MFLRGRGGVSAGAVRAVAAFALAVHAESEEEARERSEVSRTQTKIAIYSKALRRLIRYEAKFQTESRGWGGWS